MQLEVVQLVLATIGAAVGLLTAWKAVSEYRKQGTIRRIEFFLEARKRLNENPTFQEIINLLETDNPALTAVPLGAKISFVGFFEEIALLLNSRVIRSEIAHYMFGYYAIRCWESQNFWLLDDRPERPLDKINEPYWSVFRAFVNRMEPMREQLEAKKYREQRYSL
ncbi:MAG TPA: hypothetical protein VFZ63_00535 [Jiangellaceae bacterium]